MNNSGSGSGAQERDVNAMGFKIFKHLADSLARRGIAAYRFDDRGTGASTGDFANATLDTLVNDVKAVINYFYSSPDFGFNQIILLGHSQGGIVASKAAVENSAVEGVILMASPGLTMREILRYQVRDQFDSSGLPEELVEEEIEARERLFDALKNANENEITKVREAYRRHFAKLQREAGMDSARAHTISRQQTKALVSAFESPQMQSLYDYEPTSDLRDLNVPVLALFGEKDMQIPPSKNRTPVEEALKKSGADAMVKTVPEANHLFQKAKTGKVSEYAGLDKQFTDGFTNTIAEWIQNRIENK